MNLETLIEFFSLQNPNVRYVVLGSVLLSVSSAIVGCFTFLKKKALLGDVVSHAVLPGICISFMVSGTKDPFLLIIGAFLSGWLSIIILDYIVANSKIKEDTATGLSLSVFFGVGILLLTVIQHSGNAAQSGLDSFLFGKAAALVGKDLLAFSIIASIILIVVYLFYKEFELVCFDQEYARSIGVPVKRIELLLTSITVLAVVTGIQAVGVVLMSAMLITPAAAGKFWTNKLSVMLLLASLFGAFSGIAGAYISYTAPSMPTGPWIVVVLSFIAILSFFFAPEKGILIKLFKQRKIRLQLLEENLLKSFYKIGEINADFTAARSNEELIEIRRFSTAQFKEGLSRLSNQGFIKKTNGTWSLTNDGLQKGMRVVKLHRLWELYLTKYLRIAPDHVHEDADTIEHVITPEIEERLEKLLEYPEADPHSSNIPYN
ncbi:MAG: iron chelate uptake ABC transporter family permease subunit [Marinoscillum sp.]